MLSLQPASFAYHYSIDVCVIFAQLTTDHIMGDMMECSESLVCGFHAIRKLQLFQRPRNLLESLRGSSPIADLCTDF